MCDYGDWWFFLGLKVAPVNGARDLLRALVFDYLHGVAVWVMSGNFFEWVE